ncbi:hypothetical protein [Lysinibacillus xylanilyticus]|uniref:hypothetical protein n=1 Tax=Lysinibacillus xylanilyticus TaxID=582475 RepID=UPI003CFD58BE
MSYYVIDAFTAATLALRFRAKNTCCPKRLIGRPQEALLCAKAKRQRQCFICAKAKRQQQCFICAKAKRQQQMFSVATAKRSVGTEINSRFAEEQYLLNFIGIKTLEQL